MWNNIYAGDHGWLGKVRLTQDDVPLDISGYATLQFILRTPAGETVVKGAEFTTDGTDGLLQYLVQPGDIVQTGTWMLQARISKPGVVLTSQPVIFTVGRRLDGVGQ
jgi:hypothetical protein